MLRYSQYHLVHHFLFFVSQETLGLKGAESLAAQGIHWVSIFCKKYPFCRVIARAVSFGLRSRRCQALDRSRRTERPLHTKGQIKKAALHRMLSGHYLNRRDNPRKHQPISSLRADTNTTTAPTYKESVDTKRSFSGRSNQRPENTGFSLG